MTKVFFLVVYSGKNVLSCFRGPTVPAPGNRLRDTGALGNVGKLGYIWSSASYNSGDHYRGMCIGFHVTWLSPGNMDHRGHGLQLRCLSE